MRKATVEGGRTWILPADVKVQQSSVVLEMSAQPLYPSVCDLVFAQVELLEGCVDLMEEL